MDGTTSVESKKRCGITEITGMTDRLLGICIGRKGLFYESLQVIQLPRDCGMTHAFVDVE